MVGYTNAGKSTLFNQLTSANTYVADKLFATLDPTLRKINLPHFGEAMLVDTVGFISNLPHDLVEAFKATLEETRSADLLLHVIDAHDPNRHENAEEVNKVLAQIEADQVPQLIVFNKIDLLDGTIPKIDHDEFNLPKRVWVSAAVKAAAWIYYIKRLAKYSVKIVSLVALNYRQVNLKSVLSYM